MSHKEEKPESISLEEKQEPNDQPNWFERNYPTTPIGSTRTIGIVALLIALWIPSIAMANYRPITVDQPAVLAWL